MSSYSSSSSSSSSRRKTTERRLPRSSLDDEMTRDAETAAAVSALQSWTSPRVGSSSSLMSSPQRLFQYEKSPQEWLERTLNQDEDDASMMDVEEDEVSGGVRTPSASNSTQIIYHWTTPRILHRADTPVMSNSSKKATSTPPPPTPVATPYVPRAFAQLPATSTTTTMFGATATTLDAATVQACRAYHDALCLFRTETRHGVPHAALHYLHALQDVAYHRCPPVTQHGADPLTHNPCRIPARKEGNCWSLLPHLCPLGVETAFCLSTTDAREARRLYVAAQALRVDATPAQVATIGPPAPAALRRWAAVVRWLEACHNAVLSNDITRPRPSSTINVQDGCLLSHNRAAAVKRAALNLILAGRLSDALKLATDSGLDALAAQWGGGLPADGTNGGKLFRPVWQAVLWKKAELEPNESSSVVDDCALAALLSGHVNQAWQSTPLLRTWERALYVVTRATLE